jgi:hypothetical protein
MKLLAVTLIALAAGAAFSSQAADTAAPVSARHDAVKFTTPEFELYRLDVYRGKALLATTNILLSPNMPGAAKSLNSMSYAKDCDVIKASDGTVQNIVLKPDQIDSGIVANAYITPFGDTKDLQLHVSAKFTELQAIRTDLHLPDCVVQKPVVDFTNILFNTHELAIGVSLEQTYGDKRVVLKRN